MTPIEVWERHNRRQATRRLGWSTAILSMTVVLAIAVSGSTRIEPNGHTPQLERLERINDRQADQLAQLRQLFTYCRQSVNWDEDRCATPGTSPQGSSLSVSQPFVREVASDDDDDDGDERTTVVVQQARPTASPSRGSQRPDPATNQRRTGPDHRNSQRRDRDSDRDRGTGSRPPPHRR